MGNVVRTGRAAGTTAALLTVLLAGPASAVIVQPSTAPGGLFTPPAAAFGRWNTNATAVAIGPNHILTTRHQSSLDSSNTNPPMGNVVINGVTYKGVSQTTLGAADLRVVQISKLDNSAANLTTFLPVWDGPVVGQRVVMGGFGYTRGAFVPASGGSIPGYDWARQPGVASNIYNQQPLTFGDNVVDQALTLNDGFYNSPTLRADFDQAGTAGATAFEAMVGLADSGGAWTIFKHDQWWIVGLSNNIDSTAGLPLGTPPAYFGQNSYAVNATSLITQIESAAGLTFPDPILLPEPALAGAIGAGTLLMRRRRRA